MIRAAMFDTKPYDRIFFDSQAQDAGIELHHFEHRLDRDTAQLAKGYDVVIPFVNDVVDGAVVRTLAENGVKLVAMRCAGYNNVALKTAKQAGIPVVRVPAYSPHAVAEHAMALLLTLVRRTHRAYIRTRDHNFSLAGLVGFDLHGKTVGLVGTGRIGRAFIQICQGFGMRVLAYDPQPAEDPGVEYVTLDELCTQSHIVSLHCPLTRETHHIIGRKRLAQMRRGVILINTSRGALVDSHALLEAIRARQVGGACLDVYEEESDVFYEDVSDSIIEDEVLTSLISMPNVIVSSHQAFLTEEALENIAQTTVENIAAYFQDGSTPNAGRI